MTLVIVLDFDGTAYDGDLAVQAYGRRVAESVDAATATWLIGGMRAFLEGRPAPAGMPPGFGTAEDGYEIVQALSDAAAVPTAVRRRAYTQSREDLQRSAFAVDPQPGLAEWLAGIDDDHRVWLVTNAPPVGIAEVLDGVGLTSSIHDIIPDAGKPAGMVDIAARALTAADGRPARLLAVGDRWAADLAAVHDLGGRTAQLDRFGRGVGSPTWRGPDLACLLPALKAWSADPEGPPDAY